MRAVYIILYVVIGWIWQFPQTLIGWLVSRFFKDRHIGPAGFNYVLVRSQYFPVICLGEYLFIGKTNLTRFCYGRGILSRRFGPLFLPIISFPSLILFLVGVDWYMNFWGTIESLRIADKR